MIVKTIISTSLALLAFAANSVLCRLALGGQVIDASSFTIIRLLSGTLALFVIFGIVGRHSDTPHRGSWFSSIMLFVYAITFSYAYISLDTATGALILFGVVQISIITLSLISGSRLHVAEWVGVSIAFAGFVYLLLPGVSTPSVKGFVLMTLAGVAWGIYTLRGRGAGSPLADTCYNFLRTTPIVLILGIVSVQYAHYSLEGVALAVISGAVASGVGYTIWYIALTGLNATQAAVVQLLVPVIAALGGIVFVAEAVSIRLVLSASMILGGILVVILGRYYFIHLKPTKKES
ncbi:MAG: DMT family transporter [Gammaproteobacteria bacterium]